MTADNVIPTSVPWAAIEKRKAGEVEEDHLAMFLSDYHVGEWDIAQYAMRAEVRVVTVWEGYHDAEWIEAMTYNETAITTQQRDKVAQRVYELRFGWYENHYGIQPHDNPLEIDGITVLAVTGKRENLQRLASLWADSIRRDVHQVGGDDSYFDYFPGEVRAFWQLCKGLGLDALYGYVLEHIMATRYKDETEDLFPTWDAA